MCTLLKLGGVSDASLRINFGKTWLLSSPIVTLLNIPGFIERLCKLATRKVSEATGTNFLQELEDWYTWLDNALVLDTLMQMATEEAEQSSTGESLILPICPFLVKTLEL